MIYLIQDCYKDSNNNYHDILKIGYSKDDFDSIRKPAYDTHNYGYTLLYQREGSIELEKYLHKKFKSLLLLNSTEWFSYSQDIIDSFNNITEEDILKEDYIISKEEYIEMCREYILSCLIPSSEDQYNKYLKQLLSDLKDLYENSYKDILPWEEDIYKKFFKEGLQYIENLRKSFWKNYNFKEELNDLPQNINLPENPWKNRAELFYKTSRTAKSKEEFEELLNKKREVTNEKLENFLAAPNKTTAVKDLKTIIDAINYKEDYVAVNNHSGTSPVPVFNELVYISEKRAFDIQQIDYKDRFSVFNTLLDNEMLSADSGSVIKEFLVQFNTLPEFCYKMKLLCESNLSEGELSVILDQIPLTYKTYYNSLGPERLRANGYNITKVSKEFSSLKVENSEEFISSISSTFIIGERYSKAEIKEKLREIYESLGSGKTSKASDLFDYFDMKDCKVQNKETGRSDNGFLIIRKK